jgi:hypothetical protein
MAMTPRRTGHGGRWHCLQGPASPGAGNGHAPDSTSWAATQVQRSGLPLASARQGAFTGATSSWQQM